MTGTPDPSQTAYPSQLAAELGAVGIRGRRRERIVAEIEDHLATDPRADLGTPRGLAHQFADQLGTGRARRAAGESFAALAVAGILFGGAFVVGAPHGVFAPGRHSLSVFGWFARTIAAVSPQIALAAGLLAGLRALHRRGRPVIAGAEARVIVLRAWVATGFGLLSMLALAAIALSSRHGVSHTWHVYTLVASGVGTVILLTTVPGLLAADHVTPTAPGERGDIFDDLGPLAPRWLRGHPWRLALLVAGGIAVLLSLAGVVADDPYDGIIRGLGDGCFCLLCFGTIGRVLGLWRPRAPDPDTA